MAQGQEITVAEPSRFRFEATSDGSDGFYGLFSHMVYIWVYVLFLNL